jgi:hypothetical protein
MQDTIGLAAEGIDNAVAPPFLPPAAQGKAN